ncbi:MAG: hypothetical protein QOJ65_2839 [Fimbriimonadaceae bacterium]|jgi:predicted amidohydrolase|nr:hypothetical protein [Fimbriimonadaceae bacterium]
MIKIACVQTNVAFGDADTNAANAINALEALHDKGVQVAVFPEAYLTGYCVDSQEGAAAIAIPAQSSAIECMQEACDQLGMVAVAGFAEKTPAALFNAAVLLEAGEEPRFYRKSHLPELGLDKFVEANQQPLKVFDTKFGRIGVLICFDMRPPEATRVLALEGAELIVLPTNWPVGAEVSADFICIARAAENRVFFATCNRVGEENGFKFIGRSKIIDPVGKVLASAGDGEETIIADIDLEQARQKRTVTIPGKYETEIFKARRPDLYGELTRNLES